MGERIESTEFSDFIRNAPEAEKERIYREVMDRAIERQAGELRDDPLNDITEYCSALLRYWPLLLAALLFLIAGMMA